MATQVVVYQDFSGGDEGRGRPAPVNARRYKNPGSTYTAVSDTVTGFRGSNAWVYPNGAIGPRPAFFPLVATGLPTGKSLRRLDYMIGEVGTWIAVAFADGTVYSTIAAGGNTFALRGTLPATPLDSDTSSDLVAYCTATGSGGMLTSNGTFTLLPNMPFGNNICFFGERLVVMQNAPQTPPVLRFSAPRDYTTWNVLDSVFVGLPSKGFGMYVQRDTLIIVKIDGTIWQYSGVVGINDTLRQVDQGRFHPIVNEADGAVVGTSVLYYVTGTEITAFTGAQALPALRPDILQPPTGTFAVRAQQNNVGMVIPLASDQQFIVLGTVDGSAEPTLKVPYMQSYHPERGWGRHTVPFTPYRISTAFLGGLTSRDSARSIAASRGIEGTVLLAVPSDVLGAPYNTTLRLYLLQTLQEMPYISPSVSLAYGVTSSAVVDGDTALPPVADVMFGEWWAPEAGEVTVRSVLVDYSYDSDAAITSALSPAVPNKFTISVMATEPADGTAVTESTGIAFVPTAGTTIDASNDTVKRGRELFQFGEQGAGGGFRIHVSAWSGIVIHSFVVECDIEGTRF